MFSAIRKHRVCWDHKEENPTWPEKLKKASLRTRHLHRLYRSNSEANSEAYNLKGKMKTDTKKLKEKLGLNIGWNIEIIEL